MRSRHPPVINPDRIEVRTDYTAPVGNVVAALAQLLRRLRDARSRAIPAGGKNNDHVSS